MRDIRKKGRSMRLWNAWLRWGLVALLWGTLPAWGASLPSPPAGLEPVTPALIMPVLQLPDVSGVPARSDEWRGKVVLVRFWATW